MSRRLASPGAAIVGFTLVAMACAVIAVSDIGHVTNTGYSVPGSQSGRAETILHRRIPDGAGAWLIVAVSAPSLAEIARTVAPLRHRPDVAYVETLAKRRKIPGALPSRTISLLGVRLRLSYEAAERRLPQFEAMLKRASSPATSFVLLGEVAISRHYAAIVENDLRHAETLALPVSFAALLVAFLSFAATVLPIVAAAMALILTLACIKLLSLWLGLSVFSIDTSAAVALGLSIDYALMIVTRFREEVGEGAAVEEAIARTMRTAGRTVVLSGLTIAASLPALLVVDVGLFASIAVGGIVASLAAVLVATAVLPAALRLFGEHIDRVSVPTVARTAGRRKPWRALSMLVTSRPALAALASVAVLLVLAIPSRSLQLDFRNLSALPGNDPITHELATISSSFGPGANGMVEVVTHRAPFQIAPLLAHVPTEQSIWRTVKGTDGWSVLYVLLKAAPDSNAADSAVRRMREVLADGKADTFVGGVTASEIDLTERVAARMPIAIAIAIAIGWVALAIGLRSIVIPLKAVLCSILSVSATLGVLMLLFPSSNGHDRLAFFVPLVMFVLLLGLSNDYEVFLLSRVRELARSGSSTRASVRLALERTARPITLSAYTVAATFAVFAFSSLEAMRQLGIGVAVGAALDVSIVRCLLVPACTVLLGRWNWWYPRLPRTASAGRFARDMQSTGGFGPRD